MSAASELLSRYLEQRRELGETELILGRRAIEGLRTMRAAEAGANRGVPRAIPDRAEPTASVSAPAPAAGNPSETPRVELVSLGSLESVANEAKGCVACGLAATRANVVFGEGDPNARVVIVGEAPGADEDRTGRPFVGRAGRLLDKLLASIGLARETVYICNVLKCRPPGNRNPLPDEVESCNPFLRRQLQLVRPRAILACGAFSARTLLESNEPISRMRGMSHQYEGIPLIPTYHPAALLRNPAWIRPTWDDLQRLRSVIDS